LKMARTNRRSFLQIAGAVAVGAVLPRAARPADVNSQIRMAVVGFNGRGKGHISGFRDQLVALCDCDQDVLDHEADKFERSHDRKLDRVTDFRRLLDRKDIDAISIATPNHTHALIAILAIQSGKDVYCEKPVSQTVWEGQQLVKAADHHERIVQCGTQARSHRAIQEAVEYVRSGKLGNIQYVIGTCYKARPAIGKLDHPLPIPQNVDYDLWCGPAAKVDLFRPRLHYDWHWNYATGNGDMGNQGIHQMDVARWFLGVDTLSPRVVSFGGRLGYDDAGNTANTQVVLHDYEKAPLIFETRGLPKSKAAQDRWADSMDNYRGSKVGVVVQCEKGYVVSTDAYATVRAYGPDDQVIETWRGGGDHFANFLDAVRNRNAKLLNAPILEGYHSSALCHTGNISHVLGEPRTANEILDSAHGNDLLRDSLERMVSHLRANEIDVDRPLITAGVDLNMDSASEQFTNSAAANEMLRREDRKSFAVPAIA
jgi:predicted dehydrogenase